MSAPGTLRGRPRGTNAPARDSHDILRDLLARMAEAGPEPETSLVRACNLSARLFKAHSSTMVLNGFAENQTAGPAVRGGPGRWTITERGRVALKALRDFDALLRQDMPGARRPEAPRF